MQCRRSRTHAVSTGQTDFPVKFHGENTPALPGVRKGKSGRLLRRPQPDHPAATVDEFCTAVLTLRPDAVVNAAAWTGVDAAEDHEDQSLAVNAAGPGAMALACTELSIPLVHLSTDYVFDGNGSAPFPPDHPTVPLGAYGRTKLAGEMAVRAADGAHAIVRTSWVFSAHGANFVKSMLRLSETRNEVSVVADQIGGPTPASAIAAACVTIAQALTDNDALGGTYHFTGAPDVSWADFAREIFRFAGRRVNVKDISTAEYPTKARRPGNSRLNCGLTDRAFGLARPNWRLGLRRVLEELGVIA